MNDKVREYVALNERAIYHQTIHGRDNDHFSYLVREIQDLGLKMSNPELDLAVAKLDRKARN